MTDREELFRPEALEYRQRPAEAGSVLRIGSRWTTWAFWTLLVLVIAGLVAATQIRIDRYVRGPVAASASGGAVALVPASQLSGEGAVLSPRQVEERYDIVVSVPSVPIPVDRDIAAGGTAKVLVESEPLIVALVPGLKALFGGD